MFTFKTIGRYLFYFSIVMLPFMYIFWIIKPTWIDDFNFTNVLNFARSYIPTSELNALMNTYNKFSSFVNILPIPRSAKTCIDILVNGFGYCYSLVYIILRTLFIFITSLYKKQYFNYN